MSSHYRELLSEQDARDYSDMQDQQEAERWNRERHDEMPDPDRSTTGRACHRISRPQEHAPGPAALAGRNQRIREHRAAPLAEQLPATPSRAVGRSRPITGEEYSQRVLFIRMNEQEALEELDRAEDAAGR
jgi:hypothetical protein